MKIQTPKIIFRYSWIYDQQWERCWKESRKNKGKKIKYPSHRKISNYIKKVEKLGFQILENFLKINFL